MRAVSHISHREMMRVEHEHDEADSGSYYDLDHEDEASLCALLDEMERYYCASYTGHEDGEGDLYV